LLSHYDGVYEDEYIKIFYAKQKVKKWIKRMLYLKSKRYKTLWKISEYYTKVKYHPDHILQYVEFD